MFLEVHVFGFTFYNAIVKLKTLPLSLSMALLGFFVLYVLIKNKMKRSGIKTIRTKDYGEFDFNISVTEIGNEITATFNICPKNYPKKCYGGAISSIDAFVRHCFPYKNIERLSGSIGRKETKLLYKILSVEEERRPHIEFKRSTGYLKALMQHKGLYRYKGSRCKIPPLT